MRDSIELEWAGRPAVAIVVDVLVGAAENMKRVSRMPDYPYVVTPFPVGSLNGPELAERARQVADDVLRLLSERPALIARQASQVDTKPIEPVVAPVLRMAAELDCGPDACSTTQATLTSKRIEAGDAFEAMEAFFERGWTDGMPIVPPTPARVADMLDAAGLAPDAVIGTVPTRENMVITAEKLAINAVMAGSLPEYMPLIATAMRAMTDENHNFHSHTATLSGAVQVTIVNGPQRRRLGINSQDGVFGPGWRANATIGRALRLTIRNVARSVHGEFDRSAFSHPGRYSMCFGENEEDSPWPTLAEDAGLPRGSDAVTVYASMWQSPIASDSRDPQELLRRIGHGARGLTEASKNRSEGTETVINSSFQDIRKFLFVMGQDHLRVLQDIGKLSKAEVREAIFHRMTEPLDDLPPLPITSPDNVMIASVRGPAMSWTWYFRPFYSSAPVTLPVIG